MRGPRLGARFRLAYLILALVAVAGPVVAVIASRTSGSGMMRPQRASGPTTLPQRNWPRVAYGFAESKWGKLRPGRGASELVLGPIADRRSRFQIRLTSVRFGAGIAVADRESVKPLPLGGGPTAAACLSHLQGEGVNVVMAIGHCVPAWAVVGGRRAVEWVMVENARPTPVAVYVQSAPHARLYQRGSPTGPVR
jgi:hypothetical protein